VTLGTQVVASLYLAYVQGVGFLSRFDDSAGFETVPRLEMKDPAYN